MRVSRRRLLAGSITLTGALGVSPPFTFQQVDAASVSIGQTIWGIYGAPGQSFPNPPYTVVGQASVVREKPFLSIDQSGNYRVFVPALRMNSQGTSWSGGSPAGTSIPLSQFYLALPGDTAATLNNALSQGLNLLFTPGIYSLKSMHGVSNCFAVSRSDRHVLSKHSWRKRFLPFASMEQKQWKQDDLFCVKQAPSSRNNLPFALTE